jgi:regulator of replication initiation timing
MEATFLNMQAYADHADLVDKHLSDALQTMEQQQQDYTAQIDELMLELKDSVTAIDAMTAEYEDVRVKLGDVLAQYKLDVSTYRQGCSMDKMFKALEMVAFDTDNMAMVAVQGAELWESANALADGVDRNYVIQYMEQLQRETADGLVADLNAHLTTLVVQGADGHIEHFPTLGYIVCGVMIVMVFMIYAVGKGVEKA